MWSRADLEYETRWSRYYSKEQDRRIRYVESRFDDGSAEITLQELERNWNDWPKTEQIDFSQSFRHARTCERNDILRFLASQGDYGTRSAVAILIATELPIEESVPIIAEWCYSCDIGEGANFFQAIASTNASEARVVLHHCLQRIRTSDRIGDDAKVAFDALYCIECLLQFDEEQGGLRQTYDLLKNHASESIRRHVQRRIARHFETSDT